MLESIRSAFSLRRKNAEPSQNSEQGAPVPAGYFRIKALVTPNTLSCNLLAPPPLIEELLQSIEETITFHIKKEKIPEAMHCSHLLEGDVCMQSTHHECWLLGFSAGSELAYGSLPDGEMRKKHEDPRLYEGWRKGGITVNISKTETLCCIEGAMGRKDAHVGEFKLGCAKPHMPGKGGCGLSQD